MKQFVDLKKEEQEKLLKPGGIPQSSMAQISISHCKSWAGFIFCLNQESSLGIDMEQVDRVNIKVVGAVCEKEEIKAAPSNALLWVAKESSFKCISAGSGLQARSVFLSDISISDWSLREDQTYSFCFQLKKYKGLGFSFLQENLAVASTQMKCSF